MVQTINSAYALQKIFKDWNRDYYSIEAYETMLQFYDSIDENMELEFVENGQNTRPKIYTTIMEIIAIHTMKKSNWKW